jgi:hypothetical protein
MAYKQQRVIYDKHNMVEQQPVEFIQRNLIDFFCLIACE